MQRSGVYVEKYQQWDCANWQVF